MAGAVAGRVRAHQLVLITDREPRPASAYRGARKRGRQWVARASRAEVPRRRGGETRDAKRLVLTFAATTRLAGRARRVAGDGEGNPDGGRGTAAGGAPLIVLQVHEIAQEDDA